MSFIAEQKEHFQSLSSRLFHELKGNEELSLSLSGEDSLFVRFNNSKVRQQTQVEQKTLAMSFQKGQRRVNLSTELVGDLESDTILTCDLVNRARAEIELLPEDSSVSKFENRGSSDDEGPTVDWNLASVLKDLTEQTKGTDFTGLWTSGPQVRASFNHLGQKHWFSRSSFVLDYSLYTVNKSQENKAVKRTYSDQRWSINDFMEGFVSAKHELESLQAKTMVIKPGSYRTYLAPAALAEVVGLLGWNALSYSAWRKGSCALARLAEGKEKLSPLVNIRENFEHRLTTRFNSLGEVPSQVLPLIERGAYKSFLVSSKAAKEYGVESNFADMDFWGHESPRSLEIQGGRLQQSQALQALGTGLYLGNLHYCNWSDVQAARVTGMTRYACFWVENGEIQGPIQDLRFDDSFYRFLGSQLLDLTQEVPIHPHTETYGQRHLGGALVPGALLNEMAFTL